MGHLREYCRLALKHLLQYTSIKPNPTPKISKGNGKAKPEVTPVKPKCKSGKKKTKSGMNEKAPEVVQVWVPKATFALT